MSFPPNFYIFETAYIFLAHVYVGQVTIPYPSSPSSHSPLAHDGFTAGNIHSFQWCCFCAWTHWGQGHMGKKQAMCQRERKFWKPHEKGGHVTSTCDPSTFCSVTQLYVFKRVSETLCLSRLGWDFLAQSVTDLFWKILVAIAKGDSLRDETVIYVIPLYSW